MEPQKKQEIKNNLKNTNAWLRIIFMIMFVIFYNCAIFIMWIIILFQMIFSLIAGERNEKVLPFSKQLTRYINEILLYLNYNSEEKPFPFADWPTE